MYSVMIIVGCAFVTTPWRNMTLGCSNCPMIEASVKKSDLALSLEPGSNVLLATLGIKELSKSLHCQKVKLTTCPSSLVD